MTRVRLKPNGHSVFPSGEVRWKRPFHIEELAWGVAVEFLRGHGGSVNEHIEGPGPGIVTPERRLQDVVRDSF